MAAAHSSDLLPLLAPGFAAARQWLTAYAILLARPFALMSVHPVFTRVQMSNLLKGVIATGLIIPVWPRVAHEIALAGTGGIAPVVILIVKESLLGAALGLPLGLPFWALLAAGDVVDQQRGATQGRLNDPAGFGDASVTGTLFLLCGIVLFVGTGQLETFVSVLYDSWVVWQPLATLPLPGPGAGVLALHLLDALEHAALTLGMPIILVMLLSDAAMMFVARLAPQLKIDTLSLGVRNLVFVIFIPVYIGFLLVYGLRNEAVMGDAVRLLTPVLPAAATPTKGQPDGQRRQ